MQPRPSDTANNGTNVKSVDTINLSKPFVSKSPRSIQIPDFLHFFRCQFRPPLTLAYRISSPSLFDRILNIVVRCANKQMFWIAASRIVAFMKRTKSFWYFPKCNLEGNSVARLADAISSYTTIPIWISIAKPRPTFIRVAFLDFIPKPLFKSIIHLFNACLISFETNLSSGHLISISKPHGTSTT